MKVIKILDSIKVIQSNPEMYLGASKATADILLNLLKGDAELLGQKTLSLKKIGSWSVLVSNNDWLSNNSANYLKKSLHSLRKE